MKTIILILSVAAALPARGGAGVSVQYGSYLGGDGQELVYGLCVNPAVGRYYVAGSTMSADYPVTPGVVITSQQSLPYYPDGFITAFDSSTHELICSTYFGGDSHDQIYSIDHDAAGNLYICGWTYSSNLPTDPGAIDPTHDGSNEQGFIASLSPDLDRVRWCTYLGGAGFDIARVIHCSDSGFVYIGAEVDGEPFPCAFSYVESGDMLVAKLDAATGHLVWCGIIGLGGVCGIVENGGQLVVSGSAAEVPITDGAYDSECGGMYDGFVMALDPSDGALLWSTYLGGSSWDVRVRVAPGRLGALYFAMLTESPDFPLTLGGWGDVYRGERDLVVGELAEDGSALLWAKAIGGSGLEGVIGGPMDPYIVLDDADRIFVCSLSWSDDLPTGPDSLFPDYLGSCDGLIASIAPDGMDCHWVTYYGSDNRDYCGGLAVYPEGILVAGTYEDVGELGDIPTTADAYDGTFGGWSDAFVAFLDVEGLVPTLVSDVDLVQEGRSVVLSLQVGPLSPGDVLRAEVEADAVRTPLFLLDEGNGRYVACDDAACGGGQGARRYLVSLVGSDGVAAEILSRTLLPDCSPSRWGLSAAVSPDGGILFAVQAERPASARVSVYDLMGRRIAALEPAGMAVGLNTLEWDLRDAGGRRVPAGTYVARCVVAERVLTTRFPVLR